MYTNSSKSKVNSWCQVTKSTSCTRKRLQATKMRHKNPKVNSKQLGLDRFEVLWSQSWVGSEMLLILVFLRVLLTLQQNADTNAPKINITFIENVTKSR